MMASSLQRQSDRSGILCLLVKDEGKHSSLSSCGPTFLTWTPHVRDSILPQAMAPSRYSAHDSKPSVSH